MGKICITCKGIMNYDPYFDAEICAKCGKMERKKSQETQLLRLQQTQGVEAARRIMGVMVARY